MGKRRRGDKQRTEKTREMCLKKTTERREKREIEGGKGDAYCIRPPRVMAIVHVVY